MSVSAFDPTRGQTIKGSLPKTPALDMAFVAHWRKKCLAPLSNAVIDTQVLPTAGTTVVAIANANEVQSIALGGATGGSYNLAFGGQVTAGTNQVTNVDVGDSTGGTFTLTIYGQTTTALAWNITKANLQIALRLLTNTGSDVTVTGTDGGQGGTPFILTFTGAHGAVPVTVTGSGASLTGNAHTLTIATATPGVGILYTATAATIQADLVALTSIGTGNVTVTGSVGGPFTVTFTGSLAAQGQALLTSVDGTTGGTGVVLSRTTNGMTGVLDVARNLSVVANVSGVTGNVVVTGVNLNNDAITETLALNGLTSVVGNKAFKAVTSITFPTRTHASDTVSVGIGSKLGLHHKQTNDTVFRTHLNDVIEGTAPTVAFSSTALESNTVLLNSALVAGQFVDFNYLA